MAKAKVRMTLDPEAWAPDVVVKAIGPDDRVLAAHVSSSEVWARRDIQRSTHLDAIADACPDGYELVWEF